MRPIAHGMGMAWTALLLAHGWSERRLWASRNAAHVLLLGLEWDVQ